MSQNYLLFSISWIIGSLAMAGFPQKIGASALQSRASKYMRRAIVLRWLPCPWLWLLSEHVESYTAEGKTPSSTFFLGFFGASHRRAI
jgi:hypothetical protein